MSNKYDEKSCPFSLGDIVFPKGQPSKAGSIEEFKVIADKTRCLVKGIDGSSQLWPIDFLIKADSTNHTDSFDKFADYKDLLLKITYHKLKGKLTDVIYSLEASQTDFYPHQYKPVLKLLESPCEGILLADEVGLGKTIEAGLLWTELKARFQSKRLLVICPAILREKWRCELLSKFGVKATIANAEQVLTELKEAAADPSYSYSLIASYDGLRPPNDWDSEEKGKMQKRRDVAQLLYKRDETQTPIIDLLISDEAHKARNPSSQTYQLLNLLCSNSRYKALLSATPIQLKSDNLFRLLNLLDPDAFENEHVFQKIIGSNVPLVHASDNLNKKNVSYEDIQNLLEVCSKLDLLKESKTLQDAIELCKADISDEKKRVLLKEKITQANLLNHVISRSTKREVFTNRVIRDVTPFPIELNEEELDFYNTITNIIRKYAEENEIPGGFLYVTPQMQISSSILASLNHWQKSTDGDINDSEDLSYEESSQSLDNEKPLLNYISTSLSATSWRSKLGSNDSKFEVLSHNLITYLSNNPKAKIVLFAFFKSTLRYLQKKLDELNIQTELLIGGGVEPKETIIDRFKSKSGAPVLLSSEVGSEGIDLQFSELIINYDLPWNPMRLEQRIGRLDRIGQKAAKINIWNFYASNTIDAKIYNILYDRLKLIEFTIGGMEQIIGEEIAGLKRNLFSTKLSEEEEEEKIEQTAIAIENKRKQTEDLENDAADLIAHGDYITNKINSAKDNNLWLRAQDIESFTTLFLKHNFPNTVILPKDNSVKFSIKLCSDADFKYENFCRSENLPIEQLNNCIFGSKTVDNDHKNVKIINQFHSLVRFGATLIEDHPCMKLDKFKSKVSQKDTNLPAGKYAYFISKWGVTGIRDYEKLDYRLKEIGGRKIQSGPEIEQLIGNALNNGDRWINPAEDGLDASTANEEMELCRNDRDVEMQEWFKNIKNRNHDRIELQIGSLKTRMQRKLDSLNNSLLRATNPTVIKRFETQIKNTESDLNKRIKQLNAIKDDSINDLGNETIIEIAWGLLYVK